jgi:hypothetical protein
MRSVHYIALSLFVVFISGCEGPPGMDDTPDHDQVCPGSNPGQHVVVITFVDPASSANQNPSVDKDNLVVEQGDKIKFILNGPNKNVVVSTSGKSPEAGWLNGGGVKNSDHPGSERFFVCVPKNFINWDEVETKCDGTGNPDEPKCKEFAYDVMATGHETLDPVVTVQEF